jgi:hypothetical protein
VASVSNSNGLALSCAIPATTLTANGNGTYLWSTGATTPSITVSTAGTFTVTITGNTGCISTASVTTTLNNTVPVVSISNNNGLALSCSVPNTTLTANGSGSYLWSTGAITPSIIVTNAGTFTVTVTGASGCSSAASATVTVNPQPTAYSVTGTGSYCTGSAGSPVGLSGSDIGVAYQLQSGGNNVGTAVTGTGAAISFGNQATGIYTVLATNTTTLCTLAMNGSAILTVNPLPTVTAVNGTTTICSGSTTTLTASSAASSPVYNWYGSSSGGSAIYIGAAFTTAPLSTATTYYVAAIDGTTGCASSPLTAATVSVNPLPTATISATGITVCANGTSPSVTFSGSGSTAPFTYSYYINGVAQAPITDNGSGSITIQVPTSASGTFVYTLTGVQDASSTQCSQNISGQSATVIINPLPVATISGATAVCEGTASPNITFAGSGGTAPYTFTYSLFNGATTTTMTATGNPATVPVPTTIAGIYTYTLTSVQDANSCPQAVASQSVQVTVNPLPGANISTASMVTAVSAGNIASVNIAGAGAIYAWTITNGTITAGAGTNSITYTAGAKGALLLSVSVTGPTGCGPVSSGTPLVIPITALPCPNPAITSPWVVCSASTGNTASVAKISGSKYVWSISNGTIIAGAGTSTISYIAGAFGFVTLSATVTNASGQCTVSSGKYYVVISPLPSAAIAANASVCASSTGNIAWVPGSGLGSTYAWSITNGTITSGSGTSKIIYTASGSGIVTLSVTVTNAVGCKASSGSKSITVSGYPVVSVTAASSVCASSSGNTASVASAGSGAKYAWNITNGWITSGAGTGSITYTASKTGSITLSVSVTNSSGCSTASGNKIVSITALPSATITTSSTVCAGSTGNTASVAAVSGGTYVWTLSSGSTITSGNGTNSIKYTTPASGTALMISVTVSNGNGCKASVGSVKVTITASVTPTFASIATLCLGSKAPVLPGKSLNGVTGTWNPAKINTSVTGVATYTFTPTAGQCATAATVSIKVQNCNAAARVLTVVETVPALDALILPNPSHNQFTLVIKGNRKEIAKIIVYDILGRPIELLQANTGTAVKFGMGYLNGIYIVEVVQGTDRKLFKAVKQ